MNDYLLLRLYGSLASWGEIAVGEMRHSAAHPSRSALLGLLGAALGIERSDDAGQQGLAQGYRFGIKLEQAGMPLRDYHTVQVGTAPRKFSFRSRRQELAAEKVETMLSAREYRCDSIALIAVEALPQAPCDLERLAAALRQPRFLLYLGRKSCPLALPLAPHCVQASSLREAFDRAPPPHDWLKRVFQYGASARQVRYYWEEGMEAGMQASFDSWRHDQPLSRRRWQFAPRRESVALEEGGTR
ncbi:MAG: type I-E CRISPR-associated protein Cas5/CasD [Zoogloeaceae bacterium]|jgi:CRISPR system Cascade subunit CasD|nr:type I-E CRISPR-associated protein Cas5/CasD [Zoogloeaceae bacterium]